MTDDGYELSRLREMVNDLIHAGEKELKCISELGVPRLVLGRDFGTLDPWAKEDLDQTFRSALSAAAAAESRLLNSAATSDGPASRYVTWLYALLLWFRDNPELERSRECFETRARTRNHRTSCRGRSARVTPLRPFTSFARTISALVTWSILFVRKTNFGEERWINRCRRRIATRNGVGPWKKKLRSCGRKQIKPVLMESIRKLETG